MLRDATLSLYLVDSFSMNRSESNLPHWGRVGQRSDVDYLLEGDLSDRKEIAYRLLAFNE